MRQRVLTSLYLVALTGACVLGAWVRLQYLAGKHFPLNDGGLFFTITTEVLQHDFALPCFTRYNEANIPLAYPPAAFYLAGLLTVLGAPLVSVFLYLPSACSVLCFVPLVLLARELRFSRPAQVGTVVGYSFLLYSYQWQIMGGGLTRSLGILCSIVFCAAYLRSLRRGGWWLAPAGASFALSALAHGEGGLFCCLSLLILCTACGPSRAGLRHPAAAAGIAALLVSPWLFTVYSRHGLSPFFGAASTVVGDLAGLRSGQALADTVLSRVRWSSVQESLPFLPYVLVYGSLVSVLGARWYLPLWWVLELVLDGRSGGSYATLPMSLLVGAAAGDLVTRARSNPCPVTGRRVWKAASFALLSVFIGWVVFTAYGTTVARRDVPEYSALPGGVLRDFAWIRTHTPPGSAFFVIEDRPWWLGQTSEWFPSLTGRRSIRTVQGTEWLPGGTYDTTSQSATRFGGCGSCSEACLADAAGGRPYGYVYLPRGDSAFYRACDDRLRGTPELEEVYRDGGVVFRRVQK